MNKKHSYSFQVFIADLPVVTQYNQLCKYIDTKVGSFRVSLAKKKGSKKACNAVIQIKSADDYNYLLNTKFVFQGHQCQVRPYLNPDQRVRFNQERLERRVYINQLSIQATEADLRHIFQQFGRLEKIYLKNTEELESDSKKGNIYGFVTFSEISATRKCLQKRNEISIMG